MPTAAGAVHSTGATGALDVLKFWSNSEYLVGRVGHSGGRVCGGGGGSFLVILCVVLPVHMRMRIVHVLLDLKKCEGVHPLDIRGPYLGSFTCPSIHHHPTISVPQPFKQ